MPKRTDINKIMIIGSGPIIIGQACEFDYSGSQACKALRRLGYKIVLVNSNPATIMTDPNMADATYIEPLNIKRLTEIIKKERPCAILPSLGGQSALNLCMELENAGIHEKYGVKVIGVQTKIIQRGEDRIAFKETMKKLNIDMPISKPAYSVEEAVKIAKELGFPVVIRPAFTLGGTGGGLVYNIDELKNVASRGISASLIGQILVEESILGWDELELEVIRDSKDQMITVCFIENVDPVGVHTGDSICVAPMLTIDTETQNSLEKYAHDIVREIGVVGGTNVQFAHNPENGRIVVIEINPRTSRSSALASKAVGLPIALVSAMLAAGITLDEIPYWKNGTLDKYTPDVDHIVVKFPRWTFEKYSGAQDKLGTQMKAVGEVMSVGKNYKEAFQKSVRSLEIGRYGLGFAKNYNSLSKDELMNLLKEPSSERQFIMYEALRKGASVKELHRLTHIKEWFIQQMKELLDLEEEILKHKGGFLPEHILKKAKKNGFSDRYIAQLLGMNEKEIRSWRNAACITASWGKIPVSGVENSEYYFSTYNFTSKETLSSSNNKKVMILGSGPNRIGQGIEFDYCCVHAAYALREMGYETIMVNCNPETVSTDYDTSDKLFFEPLTVEDVLNIFQKEKPIGVIVQFGGQTPLNIAEELANEGVRILGTSLNSINFAEDRDMFRKAMKNLNIPMPESGMASNLEEALLIAKRIGYPLMVRPSFVLGGRGMEVVYDEDMLRQYIDAAVDVTPDRPVLIDKFLDNAVEAEADAISDGCNVYIPAVMEHIELAGIHSGDSACVIPTVSISEKNLKIIHEYTEKIAKELKVVGLMNIQYAIAEDKVYVIEANPRASRTVPLVSKVCNISMARIAAEVMMAEAEGEKYDFSRLAIRKINHYGVKEAVFPFNMFPEVDPVLGPEMRSTGEVLGIAPNFGLAFFKAEEAAMGNLPDSGTVLISVKDQDKEDTLDVAKGFATMGFSILATSGTAQFFKRYGVESKVVMKLNEGRPNILDCISNGEIDLIINTPIGKHSQTDDSYIRKAAIRNNIPYITTIAAARASVKGIEAYRSSLGRRMRVKSLQEYQ